MADCNIQTESMLHLATEEKAPPPAPAVAPELEPEPDAVAEDAEVGGGSNLEADRIAALETELSGLKMRALIKRAEALNIPEVALDEAGEAEDDRVAIAKLILDRVAIAKLIRDRPPEGIPPCDALEVLVRRAVAPTRSAQCPVDESRESHERYEKLQAQYDSEWTEETLFHTPCPGAWTVGQLRGKLSQLLGEEVGLSKLDRVGGTKPDWTGLYEPRFRRDAYVADDVRLQSLLVDGIAGGDHRLELWWLPWPPLPAGRTVIVKTSHGREFYVSPEGSDSIEKLKELIWACEQTDKPRPRNFRLFYHNMQLSDGRMLADYNIGASDRVSAQYSTGF